MVTQHVTRLIWRWGVVLWLGAFLLVLGVWQISQLWQAHQQALTFLGWDGSAFAMYYVPVPDGEPVRLRDYAGMRSPPVWSPDGLRFAIDTDDGIMLGYPLASGHSVDVSDRSLDQKQPRWSPDGRWLAYNVFYGRQHDIALWRSGSDRAPYAITHTLEVEGPACWSPDSSQLAYDVDRGDRVTIELITLQDSAETQYTPTIIGEVDGPVLGMAWSPGATAHTLAVVDSPNKIILVSTAVAEQRTILRHDGYVSDLTWSPDGRYLLFVDGANVMMSEVYALEVATRELRNLSDYPGLDMAAVWSPDGQWIAWVSNRGQNAAERNVVLMHAATGAIRELTDNFAATGGLAWWP